MNSSSKVRGRLDLEAMEPRLLLSGDSLGVLLADEFEGFEEPADAIIVQLEDEVSGQIQEQKGSDIFGDIEDESILEAGPSGSEVVDAEHDDGLSADEPVGSVATSQFSAPVSAVLPKGKVFGNDAFMTERIVMTLHAANGPPVLEAVDNQLVINNAANIIQSATVLSNDGALGNIITEARANWAFFVSSDDLLGRLDAISVSVADLPDGILGVARGLSITLDADGAGQGWFTDSDISGLSPDSGVDLLTVVMHEMGHVLGLADTPSDSNSLMSGIFSTGMRHMPSSDLAGRTGAAVLMSPQYAVLDVANEFDDALVDINDAIRTVVEGDENFTDPHIPGVRFDDVETGDGSPTVIQGLQIDVREVNDPPGFLTTAETNLWLDVLGLGLADPYDPAQIADVLFDPAFDSAFVYPSEPALALMDMDELGTVSVHEAFEVLVTGQIRDFINDFPSQKVVWNGFAYVFEDITFSDFRNGFTDANPGGATYEGFTSFLTNLGEPGYLSDYVEVSTSGVVDNSGANELSYEVEFTVRVKQDYLIDLGIAAEELEINLPTTGFEPGGFSSFDPVTFDPYVELKGTLVLPLNLTADFAGYTFTQTGEIKHTVSVSESLEDLTVNVGFLGMEGGPLAEFLLNFPINMEIVDPSSPYHLGFGQEDFAFDGDGSIAFDSSGVASATFAVDPHDVIFSSNVFFDLTFGSHDMSAITVTISAASTSDNLEDPDNPGTFFDPDNPGDSTDIRENLLDDLNDALTAAGLDGIVTASLDVDDLIVLTLVTTDATALGFDGQEKYVAAGGILIAEDLLEDSFPLVDGSSFSAEILVSLAGADPVLIVLDFTINGADATQLKNSFLTQAQADIDTALGAGELTIGINVGGFVTLDPVDASDSFEITRTVVMEAEYLVTKSEFAATPLEDLFGVFPNTDLDFLSISIPLDVKSGLVVSGGIGMANEDILIQTDELILETDGVYSYPLEADIEPDVTDINRFVLGEYLYLTGVKYDPDFIGGSGTFQNLLDFNVVGPAEVANLLGQLKGWLDRLPNASMLGAYQVPFASATLGDLLIYGDLIQSYVIFDDGGNGIDPVDVEPGDANDTGRLLFIVVEDDDQTITLAFATAQELAAALAHLPNVSVDGNTAYYDMDTRELTYDVTVDQFGTTEYTAPVDFDLNLDPVFDVTNEGEATLFASLIFESTIGLNLSAAALITEGTLLSDLNNGGAVPIRTDLAVTAAGDVGIVYGRLTGDAWITIDTSDHDPVLVRVFKSLGPDPFDPAIVVDTGTDTFTFDEPHNLSTGDVVLYSHGGGTVIDPLSNNTEYYVVRVSATKFQLASTYNNAVASTPVVIDLTSTGSGASHTVQHQHNTDDNLSVSDLLADINAALATAGLDSDLEAILISGRVVLQVKPASSVSTFTITTSPDNPAFTDLGIQTTAASTVFLTGAQITNFAGINNTVTFFLDVNDAGLPVLVSVENLNGSNSVADVVNDINDALIASGFEDEVVAGRNGNRVVLAAVDSGITILRILDGTNTEDLGLAASQLGDVYEGGTFLSQLGGVFLVGEDFLDPAVNPDATIASAFGRTVNTVDLDLEVDGSPVSIQILTSETDEFTTIDELVALLNDKLAAEGVGDQVAAYLLGNSQIVLRAIANPVSHVSSIEVTTSAPELGLLVPGASGVTSAERATGLLRVAGTKSAPAFYGPTQDAHFSISYTDGDGAAGPVNVTISADETLGNRSIYDFVSDVTLAIRDAFRTAFGNDAYIPFVAAFDGQRLVIRAKADSGVTDFQITSDTTDTAVTELHLHEYNYDDLAATQTINGNRADLLIFTTDGEAHYVALDALSNALFTDPNPVDGLYYRAQTVGQVITAIENAAPLSVDAGLNDDMTGLKLVDITGGTEDVNFRVTSVNGSRSVFALGLQSSAAIGILYEGINAPLTTDPTIQGDAVSKLDLQDRMFLRQVDPGTPFLQARFSVVLHLGSLGFPEALANYGFVGIEFTGDEFYVADVAISLKGDASGNVTLARLLNALSKDLNSDGVVDVFDLNQVIDFPSVVVDPAFDTMTFSLALQTGLSPDFVTDLGLTAPTLGFQILNPGFPFFQKPGTEAFDGTDTNIVDDVADTLTLTGHAFENYDTVTYRSGQGGSVIGGLTDNTTYYIFDVSGDSFKLAKTLALAVAGTQVDITGPATTGSQHRLLRFDPVEPDIDIIETGFGTLFDFQDVSFDSVLTALQQLRDYLNEFAKIPFLSESIPVIGTTLNDLIGIAANFAKAVDDATNNPAASLQALTQKLRESFGLPPTSDIIGLELVDDDDGADGSTTDMLKISINLDQAYTEAMMVELDFSKIVDGESDPVLPDHGDFGAIKLLGNAGLEASIVLDAILSVGIDLDDDGGSDVLGEVFLFTHESDTSLKFDLDATSSLITFNAALGPLGILIIGGDGNIDINVDFLNSGAVSGDRVSLSDTAAIEAAISAFGLVLNNSFVINLPVYFPNASTYVGDILFAATWDNSGLTITQFDVPTDFEVPDFFEDFGFESSIPLAIEALDLLLEGLQGILSGQILGIPLPLIGDRLADGAEFIEDLRNDIIKPFRELVENTPKTEEELVDLIQAFLFAILGPGVPIGSDLDTDFPELRSLLEAVGLENGLGILSGSNYALIDDIIDLIYIPDNFRIEWSFEIGRTFSPDVNFDFDLGLPALGLDMDGGLAVVIEWSLGIGLGISSTEGAYINVGRANELSLSIDAGFTPNSSLTGRLGFLQLSAAGSGVDLDGNGIDDKNHVAASFNINLRNGNDVASPYLSLFDLGNLDIVANLSASAGLELDLELAFNRDLLPPVVSAILPALQSQFIFEWIMPEADVLDDAFSFNFADNLTNVRFNAVYLDLGSFLGDFLGPIVAQIQEYTDPLQPIIEILTARIPVLSDLAGQTITLVDIAASFGEFDPGLIYAIADLISFVNSIPAEPGSIKLKIIDEFILVGSGIFGSSKDLLTDPTFSFSKVFEPGAESLYSDVLAEFGALESQVTKIFGAAGEFISDAFTNNLEGDTGSGASDSAASLFGGDFNSDERGGFAFPFLEDPISILGALLGNPIVLVTYDLPPLVVEFTWEQSFPIYPPLYGVVGAGLGVKIDLAFGYDTLGVQNFVAGGFQNPLDLLSGFYISDTENPDGSGADVPELQFKGTISVGAELNAGIASAGVTAAITLTVNFDLNDPDMDGRVRISEILGNFLYELREGTAALAPIAIFDVYGDISFQLSAYIKFLFAKFSFEITPQITLFEFSVEFDREPILATERGDGALLLNIGPNAGSRLHGDANDIAETINVKYEGGKLKVWSDQFGVPESAAQSYNGNRIIAYGGEYDDIIVIKDSVTVDAYIEGNSGNDTISYLGSGKAEIYGNDGDDTLTGGSNDDIIFGGEGHEVLIDGGSGNDIIFGDEGRVSEQLITGYIREKDGKDTITGGPGRDIIFGNGDEDNIAGDGVFDVNNPDTDTTGGGDLIIGDGGRLVRPDGQNGAYTIPQVIDSWTVASTNLIGGANDIIHGHGGPDIVYAGYGDDTVDGGEGDDLIFGQNGFDYLAGAGATDTIYGGTEDDIIYGFRESGLADPHFHAANTDAGDFLFGEDGNDFIRGNDGNDEISGGRGSDIIFGDYGDDKTYGGADNDYIFGGPGNELSMQGGEGNDIIFGDDGVVVFIEFSGPNGLPYADPLDPYWRPGHRIVDDHRLIGDGAFAGNLDDYVSLDLHDGNPRTMDIIQTEVNGLTDGNDYIVGGEGDDIALGGAGDDTIFGDFDPDPLERPTGPIPGDEDILIGDGGRLEFNNRERDSIRSIVGASMDEVGVDHIYGNGGEDVIFGSGDGDFLYGRMDPIYNSDPDVQEDSTVRDDDIILGDDGEIDYQKGTGIILTIETWRAANALAVGGSDEAYGNKDADVIFGGIAGDLIKGDDGTDGDDVLLGDNGLIVFGIDNDPIPGRIMIATIETTDTEEATGGPDTIEGHEDNDVIIGGVNNGGPDLLYGDRATPTPESIALDGQDIILGDNGELIFNADGDLDSLDFIRSELLGLGGADVISGNTGNDVLIGSTGGDTMYGDDEFASAASADGEDIMLGDNGDIEFIGSVGRLLVQVIGRDIPSAVDLITTTDVSDDYGGADTMSGNAKSDIVIGGVNDGGEDYLFGDRGDRLGDPAMQPTADSIAHDLDDILIGDNGLLDFTYLTDLDRNTLDLIQSFEDTYGGVDVISGNKGLDVAIGGTAGDTIYGDNAAASAAEFDLEDLLIGDNANIFLVAVGGASGPDLKVVLDAAVKTIVTTDTLDPANTGGVDTISGNAKGDIIAGGVYGDFIYGDREFPTLTTTGNDGDDLILGDNGSFEWLSTGRLSEVLGIDVVANNYDLFNWFDAGTDTDLGTLDLVTTEQPNSGGRDTIYGDEGNDVVFGGTDTDIIYGDDGDEVGSTDNNDILFGDHGRIYPQFARFELPNSTVLVPANYPSRNFFAIDTGDSDGGAGDVMHGEEGDDLMVGQQGDDRMWGGSEDDDMIGGHNVAEGYDELGTPVIDALLNPLDNLAMNDLMDGGSGNDAMAGDNAIIWRRGDDITPRFREVIGGVIYTTGPDQVDTIVTNTGGIFQSDPDDAVGRDVQLLNHSDAVQATPLGRFGADVMAGGADADVMYGQLGDDLMQGDGSIESAPVGPPYVSHVLAVSDSGNNPDTDETLYFNIPEAVTDGNDYMEGNGGNDLMYGGLGQDDIIGGSSALFGLDAANALILGVNEEALRPDGSDIIFGGAGIDIARNHIGDATEDVTTHVITTDPTGHSRDADYIMGDNANVYRLVDAAEDAFLVFNYDLTTEFENRGTADDKIIPRAMQQLDYTLGGADYAGGTYTSDGVADIQGGLVDNGLADVIHGESGDDIIFGMTGSDVLYGEGQDDDIVGGYGNDWISGGTGQDGVLGDDGLILTSRNSTLGEPLYGIAGLLDSDVSRKYSNGDALDETISTPGDIQIAIINVTGALKKTVDLVPFSYDPLWIGMDDEFPDDQSNTPFADDIIFGGLGSDFLHGGSGDDAISGAEALSQAYVPVLNNNGEPVGILDLGYDAFTITNPINPGDVPNLTLNPGDVLAFNPIDLDGQHLNNRFRAGEFFLYDEYDPLRKILLDADGNLWKSDLQGVAYEFLLNFDESEGVVREAGSVPKATGQQTEDYPQVNDDGKDAIFGDNGNDWLVGGTGRDNLYGGWGNDLLNADDDHDGHDDSSDLNDVPDTQPTYEDRAYGGAGRDVLIANTGGDRLIDWVGEYNTYLVPYAPFGLASVSRTMQPFLPEFLYALSSGDGADPTRYVDAIGTNVPQPTRNNPNPSRNGEPFGELGLVLQKDFAWQAQTGAPADPQAGNIPGGHRDVLRTASFNDGFSDGFFADSGLWAVQNGAFSVAPEYLGGDALSVYYVNQYIPQYFEMLATLNPEKPTGGLKSNAYIIFDYQSETDFKFAGINVSSNKLEIGHRTEAGWIVDVQGAVAGSLKSGINYNVFLSVNGSTVTLVVDNAFSLTHTFDLRVDEAGFTYGLSKGMVGLGANNSIATIDNVTVQRLAPEVTFTESSDFESPTRMGFDVQTSGWVSSEGWYIGSADGDLPALNLITSMVSPAALIILSTSLNTTGEGGFVFDYYGPDDYKFVTLSQETSEILIGHRTSKGLVTDAVYTNPSLASGSHDLKLTLKGSTLSVVADGQLVLSHAFNAIVTDGAYGILSNSGNTSFDQVTFQTDDPAFSSDGYPDVYFVKDQSSYYWEEYDYMDQDWGEPTP